MRTGSNILEVAKFAVDLCLKAGATQAEACVLNYRSYLTRFANSEIHQNVGEENSVLRLRFVLGKRISVTYSNSLEERAIRNLVERAKKIAELQSEDPDFVSLPEPEPMEPVPGIFIENTAECDPIKRAEIAKSLIERAHQFKNVEAVAGNCLTASGEAAVANSLGIEAMASATVARLRSNVIAADGTSKGYGFAESISRDVEELDPEKVGEEAARRAVESLHPQRVEPGEYEVVLLPYAVATAMLYLSFYGFTAQSYQDGTSFVCDYMGKKAFADSVNIWDDGRDPSGMAFPFDSEGVPKKKVILAKDGVPTGLLYDSYYAHKEGKKSTGHSSWRPLMFMGAGPSHLFMGTGDATVDEMIQETKKGLLVTRLHYVRVVHPRKAVVTGMTRDGTWFVENGEVKGPVMNMRFTDSLISLLANVDLIDKEAKTLPFGMEPSSIRVPALRSRKFRFTGVTEY